MNVTADVLYWALNSFGVSFIFLLVNMISAIIGLAVIFFNALVVETMVQKTVQATGYSTMIIACMAVSDMFSGFTAIHMMIFNVINYRSEADCYIRLGFMQFFFLSSVLHFCLLTVNRYVKIVFPSQYDFFRTSSNVVVLSCLIWILSGFYAILPVVGVHSVATFTPVNCRSYIYMVTDEYILWTLLMIFVPLVIMNLMYFHIFYVANELQKKIRLLRGIKHPKNIRKLTLTFIVACVSYTCCWLPFGIVLLMSLDGYFEEMTLHNINYVVVYTLTCVFCHGLFNPIIYGFRLPTFKSCCKWVK